MSTVILACFTGVQGGAHTFFRGLETRRCVMTSLVVNGRTVAVDDDPRTPLLYVLRDAPQLANAVVEAVGARVRELPLSGERIKAATAVRAT